MNLNKLKPAWRQFQLLNSMQPMREQEILLALENAEAIATTSTGRIVAHALLFLVVTFCCQGG